MLGGTTSREVAEQRLIDARGFVPSLENIRNPIGGRLGLLNDEGLGIVTKNNLVNWPGVLGADVLIESATSPSPARGGSTGDGGARK